MGTVSKPTFFICYGFCEGTKSGRSLVEALERAGFQIATDANQADIFVGHSGGCLLAPSACKAKLAVCIGIPYWPDKSLVRTLISKNVEQFKGSRSIEQQEQWWGKFFWHGVYFWRIDRNIAMLRKRKSGPQTLPDAKMLYIRNREDGFMTERIYMLPNLRKASFVSLPGTHDDLWMHPDAYAAIIKAYYGANILASTKAE